MLDVSSPEVRFALDAVRKTAELAQRINVAAAVMRLTKSDFSPVTVADFAAQAVVAHLLEEAFPDDVLVAEERADDLRSAEGAETLESVTGFVGKLVAGAGATDVCAWIDRGTADPTARFWALDPVDGTKGYLRGGQYAVALALIEDGEVELGVLGCPNLGDDCQPDLVGEGALIVAVRGHGAWYTALTGHSDLVPLRVSGVADPTQARVLRSHEAAHTNTAKIDQLVAYLGVRAEPVLMDSQAKYAVMAAGGGELLFRLLSPQQPDYREKIWDQAAGSIVIEEACGRISDLNGEPLDFTQGRRLENNRGVLASNGLLHEKALEALAHVLGHQ